MVTCQDNWKRSADVNLIFKYASVWGFVVACLWKKYRVFYYKLLCLLASRYARVLKSTVIFWVYMPLIKVISIYICKQKPTFRTEVGNPTSTSRVLSLIHPPIDFFNIKVPSFVPISHLSVRSISSTLPVSLSVIIRILSQLRILQITELLL